MCCVCLTYDHKLLLTQSEFPVIALYYVATFNGARNATN